MMREVSHVWWGGGGAVVTNDTDSCINHGLVGMP